MPETNQAPPAAQGGSAPAAPPPMKPFEVWATEKFKVVFDERGRASAVKNGRRITKISHAAIVNAARLQVPVGKRMTEADFDKLIAGTRAIPISIS